jgi:hypothetical protein
MSNPTAISRGVGVGGEDIVASTKRNGNSGSSFLGCLCRPQHPNDTGVVTGSAAQSMTNSKGVVSSSSTTKATNRSIPTNNSREHEKPPKQPQTKVKLPIRPSINSHNNSKTGRDIPMIPSPPSDDATPLTSNRKSMNGGGGAGGSGSNSNYNTSMLSTAEIPSNNKSQRNLLMMNKKKKNINQGQYDASPADMNKIVLQEIGTSVPAPIDTPTDTTETTHDAGDMDDTNQPHRRVVSYYPNNVQENVKLMRDYYEQQAFVQTPSGSRSYEDATETTVDEEVTESSNVDNDDITKKNALRVDCQDDPFESAYAVWYRKGLLKWRPKSVPHSELSSGQHPMFNFDDSEKSDINHINGDPVTAVPMETQSESIDLIVVDVPVASHIMTSTDIDMDESKSTKLEHMDDVAMTKSLLQKYHNSSSQHMLCVNCQKDMTLKTIQVVKCIHCQQELYCSLFCRGNDRYQHSMTCPAQHQQKSFSSPESIKSTTQQNTPNRSMHVVVDENDISSRSNSYKKSRQAPMISLFGPNNSSSNSKTNLDASTSTTTGLSSRRLTTAFCT